MINTISSIMPLAAEYSLDQNGSIVIWSFAILSAIIFLLTFLSDKWKDIWSNIGGEYDDNNMRRLFMFNKQPYMAVIFIAVSLLISAIIAGICLFIVGGAGYLLLWLVKLLIWALIIIGWICVVAGVLCLIGMQPVGCLPLIIGGVIVYYSDNLKAFANACVEAGFNFYSALNVWDLGMFMISEYGVAFLCVVATPIVIGIIAAVITMVIAGIFWLVETIMTSRYNIKHPCPFCHNPSEPATYLSEGYKLPIKLRPGMYGLFHIMHPVTQEEMPTMILNGRDELERICPHCNRRIGYQTGVEKHIAFVGLPESGKTCLTYRFVGNMMKRYAEITFTDNVSIEAKRIIANIKEGKKQELAAKTSVSDMRRSLQIIVPGKGRMPYHFFINDVGGELFTDSGVRQDYMQFFKDVQVVSILIDPFTMDFSEYDIDGEFAKWYKENITDKGVAKKEKLSNVIQTIQTMSQQFTHKTDNIHVNLILVKADTGYIQRQDTQDEGKLRDFIAQQMGMAGEINNLENTYASLHFYAVSALQDTGIDNMTDGIIEQLKVKL